MEVGSLPVSVSWPAALHCYLCLTHCSTGNVPNPTPGPLMSTPLVNTGQPTLYMELSNNNYTGCRGGHCDYDFLDFFTYIHCAGGFIITF